MKHLFHLVILLLIASTLYGQQEEWRWLHSISGSSFESEVLDQQNIHGMDADEDGNLYVYVRKTSGGSVAGEKSNSVGWKTDIVLASIDCEGKIRWVEHIGGLNYNWASGFYFDSQEHLYISGTVGLGSDKTVLFGDFPIVLDSSFSMNYYGGTRFFARYNTSGDLQRLKMYPYASHTLYKMWIGSDGYLHGIFNGSSGLFYYGHTYTPGFFIARFTESFDVIDVRSFAMPDVNFSSIEVDSQDNLYLSGNFRDTVQFGNTTLVSYLPGATMSHGFMAKLDNNGNVVWARQLPAYGKNSIDNIKLVDGHILAIAHVYHIGTSNPGYLFFNSDTIQFVVSPTPILMQFDLQGELLKVNYFSFTASGGNCHGLSVFNDRIGIACRFGSDASIDSVSLPLTQTAIWKPYDIYLVYTDTELKAVSAVNLHGARVGFINRLAYDKVGNTYVGGFFHGKIYFGNDSISGGGKDQMEEPYNALFFGKYGTEQCAIEYTVDTTAPLHMFPNPTRGQLNFTGYIPEHALLQVFDILGRRVGAISMEGNSNSETVQLPRGLQNGLYLLTISADGFRWNGKVVLID